MSDPTVPVSEGFVIAAYKARVKELEAERDLHKMNSAAIGEWMLLAKKQEARIVELEAELERVENIAAGRRNAEAKLRPDNVVISDGKWLRIEQDPSARTRHDRVTASYTVDGVTYDDNDRPMDRTPLYRLVPVEDTQPLSPSGNPADWFPVEDTDERA